MKQQVEPNAKKLYNNIDTNREERDLTMEKKVAMRKDVAELAGVSETVVSYVINQNRYVKQEKKDAVYAAMKQLNYRPNRFARALKGKNCKHIMLLIDHIGTEYYGELVSDMEKHSANMGYLLSVSVIANSEDYVNRIIAWRVDAVIISSINFSEQNIQKLIDSGVLVILMRNRKYSHVQGAVSINTGLYQATVNGVEYLINTGCKRIAYIDRISKNGNFSDAQDFRYAGYLHTMDTAGLANNKLIISGCHNTVQFQEKMLAIMKDFNPDAFYCRNDFVATIAMNTLLVNGYKVPDDVSIIGIDDTSYSRISIPTLSSIRLKRDDIAKASIRLIEDYNNGQSIPDETLFVPELIIRESVKKLL